jgi:hypothetical protein
VDAIDLRSWTPSDVKGACGKHYARYDADLKRHYSDWFAANPGRGTRWVANSPVDALPDGWAHLADLIPPGERHRLWLSAKSSQMLALGVLGPAVAGSEPGWKVLAQSLLGGMDPGHVVARPSFEFPVPRELLQERGVKPTMFDLLIETDRALIGVECKWAEEGLGPCSCGPAAWPAAACRPDILERRRYWTTAVEYFGLPRHTLGQPCPIALPYQAVRNVAALDGLRGDRVATFVLVYDEANPYFAGADGWPGWPAALRGMLEPRSDRGVGFIAVSWQALGPALIADENVRRWARERHRLQV